MPYNRTLEVAREVELPSGIIVPTDIALLTYDQDPQKLDAPEGLVIPDSAEVFAAVMSRRYDGSRHDRKRFQNIDELYDSLTRFIAEAIVVGREFELKYSEHANDEEKDRLMQLHRIATVGKSDTEDYGTGLYL